MEIYKNLSGQSNVARYEIGDYFINVEFKTAGKDGCTTYKYSTVSTSSSNIEHMKELAMVGRGLNSFISTTVRKEYESKW